MLHTGRRASAVDAGTMLVAIGTVMAAILLYGLVCWVLGTVDEPEEVAGFVRYYAVR
jgi:hypothetical protein